jgi:large subunit ribosomal protein L5
MTVDPISDMLVTIRNGLKARLVQVSTPASNIKSEIAKVTLRGDRMWEFVERLVSAALPRIRDFRGISNLGFDGRGNYTLGLKEHSIFPELVESAPGHSGMDITFVTSSQDNKAARELLVALGMPFAGRN